MRLNAESLDCRTLNVRLRALLAGGEQEIEVAGVRGQRYLAAALQAAGTTIRIQGIPGNDLACFLGPGIHIQVAGNTQDAVGNTMGEGKVAIHGNAGDIAGYAMRGGKIFIRGDVGYRTGIHMKAYQEHVPVIIVGGNAGSFLGEYMAGGVIVVLGLESKSGPHLGTYLGTGMHGGAIYVRGRVDADLLGEGAGPAPLTAEDRATLSRYLEEYCLDFGLDPQEVTNADFTKIAPLSSRPYGRLYAY